MSIEKNIGWANETINPLGWGCYGPDGDPDNPKPCEYCYAAKFAKRNLRVCPDCQDFKPHWHGEQLELLSHWKKPRIIFVQSMGDLFSDYTKQSSIFATFDACYANKQHVYIFLTKNPKRMYPVHWAWRDKRREEGKAPPLNWWFGTTVTCQADTHRILKLPEDANRFISFEPLLEGIVLNVAQREYIDWYIVGGLSGKPPQLGQRYDAQKLLRQMPDKPIYVKDNIVMDHKMQFHPMYIEQHLTGVLDKEFLL